jgi:hypothetical protein
MSASSFPPPDPATRVEYVMIPSQVHALALIVAVMQAGDLYGRRPVTAGVQLQRYVAFSDTETAQLGVHMFRLWINNRAVAKTPEAHYSPFAGTTESSPFEIASALFKRAVIRCEADRRTVARWDAWS